MSSQAAPTICLSCGDPAGIGPEISLKASLQSYDARLFAYADPEVLQSVASRFHLEVEVEPFSDPNKVPLHKPGSLAVVPVKCPSESTLGVLESENAPYVLDCINRCVDLCLDDENSAMVTGPVNKAIIKERGFTFSGHTEWIAERCGNFLPVMMLANQSLRVCLATIHIPLSQVPSQITKEIISEKLKIMHTDIRNYYGIEHPAIGVCGLNPHAGENGHLGQEEIDTIIPCLEECKANGINCQGPFPADTLFTVDNLSRFDAILAMYHDQGLPVIKHAGFGEVVNVTLGLPIIRTSVDHGTALDIAPNGKANHSSMVEAINLAIRFAENRRANP